MEHPYTVSVLVPVYNAESYIQRCAGSIFGQTYPNLEIVFVNDCSQDASIDLLREVLKSFPQRESFVSIINHDTNKGIASARNTAVAAAHGEFLMFVDSDDWIESDTVEKCVLEQQRFDSDIVSTGYRVYEKDIDYKADENLYEDTKQMLVSTITGKISGRLWGHLIRLKLLTDHQLRFIDGADLGEDVLMMTYLWFYAKKHTIIKDCLYNYDHRNMSSCTNTFNYKNSIQSFLNLDAAIFFFECHDKHYLEYMKMQELGKIVSHMIECSRDPLNRSYYNNVLLKRLENIPRILWKTVPWKYRIILYVKNYWVVKTIVAASSGHKMRK